VALLACDPLVGGQCAEGYAPQGSSCVPTGHGSGGGGQGGASSGTGGEGGFVSSSSGTAGAGGGSGGSSSGSGGGGSCQPPLTQCLSGCVDLDSDINNCGACGVHCPTELCVAGTCVGDPVGHAIVAAMSFEQSSTATRRLLGNAVFRPLHSPVRIAVFQQYAPSATVQAVDAAIDSEATQRGRDYLMVTPEPATLPAALASGFYDLLLIHDQPLAPSGALAAVGQTDQPAVLSFLQQGGTVVALASAQGTGEMCALLTALNLLPCSGLSSVTGQQLINALPTDIVGNNVPSPLLAKPATASLVDAKPASPLVAYVLTTQTSDPVVVHLVIYP